MTDKSKLDFIMLALRHADTITIDWKAVAAEQGIKRHDNAYVSTTATFLLNLLPTKTFPVHVYELMC
jgi:hypothetical protein